MMTEQSRMAKFQAECKLRACPGCHQKRLIPRRPGDYLKMRCLNCGRLLTIVEKKGKHS